MPVPIGMQNRLLASLPGESRALLQQHLEEVSLAPAEVVHEARAPVTHAYFPQDTILSLGQLQRDGGTVAIAMIGNEGMLGVGALLGVEASPYRAQVQHAGRATRIRIQRLREQFVRGGPLEYVVLRYTQALIAQIAQGVVCNGQHSVEQQLCRWLLMTADRLSVATLASTQESIATLLGVRREGITEAAQRLQRAGLIKYNRGRIALRDRAGIEKRVCECYRVVRQEFDRLLPAPAKRKPVPAE